jgi:hypothetical protein
MKMAGPKNVVAGESHRKLLAHDAGEECNKYDLTAAAPCF